MNDQQVFKRLVPFLMNRSFFTKVFISICIVSVIGMFSVAAIYQYYFKNILIENEMDRVRRSINQAALNLDNQLTRIVNDMYYYFDDANLGLDLLEANVTGETATQDMLNAKRSLETFRLRYSGDLESVFFYRKDPDGRERLIYDSGFSLIDEIDYRTHQWYHYFKEEKNTLWTHPSSEHLFYQDRSLRTIHLTMGKYNVDGRDGIIVARLNEKMFSDAFRLLANSDLYIELQNKNGEKIYTSLPPAADVQEGKWMEMISELENTDFKVKAHVNKQAIIDQVDQIGTFTIVAIAIALILTLIISVVLSLTLVRPMRRLLALMKEVEAGNFGVRFPNRYSDEIGVLGQGFNKMVARVADLIHQVYTVRVQKMESELRQKEAVILAMQNQINPHFLYNTLEVINSHAIVNDVPSISRMSKALADFFRYSNAKQQTEVPLRDEITHVKTYLKIQEERYPQIEVDVGVPASLLSYPMIKLTLQPIIENAYSHAFNGDRDYYLRIYGEDTNERMYALYVEDNGEGIDHERIQAMNALFNQRDTDEISEKWSKDNHGIGLLNVHFRIRLRYGEPFGLHIFESTFGGITVRILLPKQSRLTVRGGNENESTRR